MNQRGWFQWATRFNIMGEAYRLSPGIRRKKAFGLFRSVPKI